MNKLGLWLLWQSIRLTKWFWVALAWFMRNVLGRKDWG